MVTCPTRAVHIFLCHCDARGESTSCDAILQRDRGRSVRAVYCVLEHSLKVESTLPWSHLVSLRVLFFVMLFTIVSRQQNNFMTLMEGGGGHVDDVTHGKKLFVTGS